MNPEPLKKSMRDVLVETIYKKMSENDRLFLLSDDLGTPALDKIRKDFNDRFINVGIAEQNLVNIATGLALEGYVVYTFAIATFLIMRAYEQIRLNLCLSSQLRPVNVNLVGVGAGVSYDVAGPTHHFLEDIAIMRVLPNMTVFSPSDWKLVEKFTEYSMNKKSPKYFRLDGKPVPSIYENINDIDFSKGFYELVNPPAGGGKTCLVATGYPVHRALKAAEQLPGTGVVDVFVLKPLDEKLLSETLKKYDSVITVEEAFLNNGGLDGLILKIIRDNRLNIRLQSLGFNDKYIFELGDRNHLHKLNNLDEESIIKTVKSVN